MDLQNKLWNMAISKSASDGERLNAIDIIEKKRPKDTLIGYVTSSGILPRDLYEEENDRLRKELKMIYTEVGKRGLRIEKLIEENRALSIEHTALKTGLASLLGSTSPSPSPSPTRSKAKYVGASSTDPHEALYGALTRTPRTIGELDAVARRAGFDGAINTLRKRAEKLEAAGLIVRADGYPKRWRLK